MKVGKPVILVVMHHRRDDEAPLHDSNVHVTREDVKRTVDILYFNGVYLSCSQNKEAVNRVVGAVGQSLVLI